MEAPTSGRADERTTPSTQRVPDPRADEPRNTITLEPPPTLLTPAPPPELLAQLEVEPRPQMEASAEGDYDLAIVGSGPGGYVAAIRATQLGLRTAIIEKSFLGGTCLNVGCIPTKAMLSSVEAMEMARRGKDFGFTAGDVVPDYGAMVARRDKVVEQLRGGVQALMKKNGIATLGGHGRLTGRGQIQVLSGEEVVEEVRARSIILATGSECARPPIPGSDLEGVVNSDQLLRLASIPKRMAVVGAGAVGLEWADIFAALGTKIVVFEMMDQILPPADSEVAAELGKILKRKGFEIHTSAMVNGVERSGEELVVKFATPTRGEQESRADVVLVATGRWPYADNLGLDAAGIHLERRAVPVNDRMQTRADGVYAIGDLVPGLQLAHVASREGEIAVENIVGKDVRIDYKVMLSDVRKERSVTVMVATLDVTDESLEERFNDLETTARADVASEGIDPDHVVLERYAEMRYRGQSYEIPVPAGPELAHSPTHPLTHSPTHP